jgi:hypothetical protein
MRPFEFAALTPRAAKGSRRGTLAGQLTSLATITPEHLDQNEWSPAAVSGIDWTPEVLPFAPVLPFVPHPINGELLSSWARRLPAANALPSLKFPPA